jgi:hypothetical protein
LYAGSKHDLAAGLFLADASDRQKLQEALRFSGSPPVYFEALIRSWAVSGAPNAPSIIATRVIHPCVAAQFLTRSHWRVRWQERHQRAAGSEQMKSTEP